MKTFIIGTAFILAITSFGSAAYGKSMDGSNKGVCQSIPPARPTGGGTRERIETIKQCDRVQSRAQQTPNTSPLTQPNPPSEVPSPSLRRQDPSSSIQPSAPDSMTQPNPPAQVPSPSLRRQDFSSFMQPRYGHR